VVLLARLVLKTPPLGDYQRKAFQFLCANPAAGLFMEQGTGKTWAAINAAAYRYLERMVGKVLVLGPYSSLGVWRSEFEKHCPVPYELRVLVPTRETGDLNLARRAALVQAPWRPGHLRVVVTNLEAFWRRPLFQALQVWRPDMVVVDESHRIKRASTKQSTAAFTFTPISPFRVVMTGTPILQSPLDAFGQYRFLDPRVFGRSWTAFKNRYAIEGEREVWQTTRDEDGNLVRDEGGHAVKRSRAIRMIVAYKHLEELQTKIMGQAYRVTLEEALPHLPPETWQPAAVRLTGDAADLYATLRTFHYARLDSGEEITADMALTAAIRLQQVSGGFTKTGEGREVLLKSNAKLEFLRDLLAEGILPYEGRKVVIFAHFLKELDMICDLLDELNVAYVRVDGSVKYRDELIERFQTAPAVRAYVGQIHSGGVSVTLTAASTCIFYSTGYNVVDFDQAMRRVRRSGQTEPVLYIPILAARTIDEYIWDALQKKTEVSRYLLDHWRQIVEGED